MSIKISEIRREAKNIINDLFYRIIKNDDKESWKKALDFIYKKISSLENENRGEAMFVWRDVRRQMMNLYGKKFIK